MKKLLLVLLMFSISPIAYCQSNLWGSSPDMITRTMAKLNVKLESQDTDQEGTLFLFFAPKDGLVAAYIFKNQLLVATILEYDTTVLRLGTPRGIEKNVDGKTVWFDYANNEQTARTYEHSTIRDGISPIE